jgi:hypothetical protein
MVRWLILLAFAWSIGQVCGTLFRVVGDLAS